VNPTPKTLTNRKALVTGASAGIGAAIAEQLAAAGADVVIVYYGQPDGTEVVRQIEKHGQRGLAIEADLSKPDECSRAVDEGAAFLGGIDILVNNAGVTIYSPIEETSEASWDASMDLNIKAQFFLTKAALPHLKQRTEGANVINISSVQSIAAIAPSAAYGASKGAVNAFTKHAAVELASTPVRVNAVAPGLTETPRYFDDPSYDPASAGKLLPVGRVGKPSDIANAVVFLAQDASNFISGQVLCVDGGTTAKLSHAGFGADPS
jgi:glucose 1-dehydrogenase